MTGTIGLAQQPSEWRPNIAEDNKAATEADTLAFLVTSLQNLALFPPVALTDRSCELRLAYKTFGVPRVGLTWNDPSSSTQIKEVVADLPAARAGLQAGDLVLAVNGKAVRAGSEVNLVVRAVKNDGSVQFTLQRADKKVKVDLMPVPTPYMNIISFDLKHLDPLTIAVKRLQGGDKIVFTGTNNGPVAAQTTRIALAGAANDQAKASLALPIDCGAAENTCTKTEALNDMNAFEFRDEETSKRYARALMHAALLCGGAKAVSPF
jgi:membrane-associated protease RseP (regulator of RpoE activity)